MSFARERLIDWRKGAWIAALIVAGHIVGSFAATQSSDAILDAIVIAGLLLVLGMLLMRPDRWLVGKEGGRCQFLRTPRPTNLHSRMLRLTL